MGTVHDWLVVIIISSTYAGAMLFYAVTKQRIPWPIRPPYVAFYGFGGLLFGVLTRFPTFTG
jgi:hypothetical protein